MEDQALKDDIKHYEKLSKINDSQEINDFFDLQIKTVADKLLYTITSDNIKSWDDFCKVRGELIAYLYPIQEVRGAKAMKKQLVENLNQYYGKQV